jgi:predicted ribosomally synthesized peptide with nif11-like leader
MLIHPFAKPKMNPQLTKFIEHIKSDAALCSRVDGIKNLRGLVSLGSELGYQFTEEELCTAMRGDLEVTDAELNRVFGCSLGSGESSGPVTCPCTWQD